MMNRKKYVLPFLLLLVSGCAGGGSSKSEESTVSSPKKEESVASTDLPTIRCGTPWLWGKEPPSSSLLKNLWIREANASVDFVRSDVGNTGKVTPAERQAMIQVLEGAQKNMEAALKDPNSGYGPAARAEIERTMAKVGETIGWLKGDKTEDPPNLQWGDIVLTQADGTKTMASGLYDSDTHTITLSNALRPSAEDPTRLSDSRIPLVELGDTVGHEFSHARDTKIGPDGVRVELKDSHGTEEEAYYTGSFLQVFADTKHQFASPRLEDGSKGKPIQSSSYGDALSIDSFLREGDVAGAKQHARAMNPEYQPTSKDVSGSPRGRVSEGQQQLPGWLEKAVRMIEWRAASSPSLTDQQKQRLQDTVSQIRNGKIPIETVPQGKGVEGISGSSPPHLGVTDDCKAYAPCTVHEIGHVAGADEGEARKIARAITGATGEIPPGFHGTPDETPTGRQGSNSSSPKSSPRVPQDGKSGPPVIPEHERGFDRQGPEIPGGGRSPFPGSERVPGREGPMPGGNAPDRFGGGSERGPSGPTPGGGGESEFSGRDFGSGSRDFGGNPHEFGGGRDLGGGAGGGSNETGFGVIEYTGAEGAKSWDVFEVDANGNEVAGSNTHVTQDSSSSTGYTGTSQGETGEWGAGRNPMEESNAADKNNSGGSVASNEKTDSGQEGDKSGSGCTGDECKPGGGSSGMCVDGENCDDTGMRPPKIGREAQRPGDLFSSPGGADRFSKPGDFSDKEADRMGDRLNQQKGIKEHEAPDGGGPGGPAVHEKNNPVDMKGVEGIQRAF